MGAQNGDLLDFLQSHTISQSLGSVNNKSLNENNPQSYLKHYHKEKGQFVDKLGRFEQIIVKSYGSSAWI